MLAIFGVVGAAFAAFMFIDTDDGATTEAEVASAPETPDVPNASLDEMLAPTDEDTVIFSGSGDDTVVTGAGKDHLEGEDGNDHLIAGTGDDVLEKTSA